jgi:MerR family transcriptional regulator, glutamine synthetase repressor
MRDEIRRNMPLFPIGIVTQLTELTPRQIRYYEQYELIRPTRTKGNQRLFSFNDIDLLLRIKTLLEKGINLAGVKEVLQQSQQVPEAKEEAKRELSEHKLRQILRQQLIHPTRPGQIPLTHGEMSRFFQH